MRSYVAKALIAFVLLAASGGAWWWYQASGGERHPAYRLAKVERGPLQAVVVASGTLNAVTTVQVGSQISGQIMEILADFNTPVKKDQVIARIDPSTFELRVTQARADVESAQSAVLLQRSAQAAQQAELGRVRVNLAEAGRDYERKKSLVEKNFLSPAELDKARTLLEATREQIKAVEAQLRVNDAQIASALATVKQREALLKQAMVDLERTVIRAPVDGTVILRNVDAGQTVAASLQAPVLFTIAQDLRDMQVEAAIDEADVGRLRVGQVATFSVDAFPRRNFSGEIRQIRKSPQNVQNVVSYTVVISAANPDLALLPGMTANVRVVVDQREDVLKIVNAALRFRPTGTNDARPAGEANAAVTGANEPLGGAQSSPQFGQRLLEALKPDETQKAKLEEIFADTRRRIAKLRELSDAAERRKQIERVRAESRVRIGQALTPAQKPVYERLLAEFSGRRATATAGRVWVLEAGKPKPVELRLGLTDGSSTELLEGTLAEGAEVIVGLAAEKREGLARPRLF